MKEISSSLKVNRVSAQDGLASLDYVGYYHVHRVAQVQPVHAVLFFSSHSLPPGWTSAALAYRLEEQ